MGLFSRIAGKVTGGALAQRDPFVRQAQNDLALILSAFAQNRYEPATTILDVFFAYRLLLNRCPERRSPRFFRGRAVEFPTPRDVTRAFMASTEFRDLFFDVAQEGDGRMIVVRDGEVQVAVDVEELGELVERAQSDLSRILTGFARGQFLSEMTALDVLFAYRLFLNRCPEQFSIRFLQDRVSEFRRPFDLSRNFLMGQEFRDLYFGVPVRDDGRVVLVRDGNLRIAVDLDDVIIGWGIINGTYGRELRWAVEHLVREGQVCVDLGANNGYFTAIMARCGGETGRVIAYEPCPRVFRMLTITVEESGLQGRVDVRQKACSDAVSESTLFFGEQVDNLGGAFLSDPDEITDGGYTALKVATTSLDGDLAGEPRIHFIKMDVEGHELRALRGMKRRLASDHPSLIMEINPPCLARERTSAGQILEFLRGCGYAMYLLESIYKGRPVAVDAAHPFSADDKPMDILCVENTRADSILRDLLAARPTTAR